jgi:hypothetical protein
VTGASLLRGDAIHLPLRAESVDLIVTSPPYFALRSYRDGGEHYEGQIGSEETPQAFLEALWAVTSECWRVLKPTGSLFVNLGDKYAGSGGHNNSGISEKSTLRGSGHIGGVSKTGEPNKIKHTPRTFTGGGGADRRAEQRDASRRNGPDAYNKATIGGAKPKSLMGLPWRYAIGCIDRGWILRAELVWSKPNGLPESVTDRVRRSHEQWFHLTKQGSYYATMDDLRVPQQSLGRGRPLSTEVAGAVPTWGNETGTQGLKGRRTTDQMNALHPDGKLPGSVWTIPSEPLIVPDHVDVDHFAAFPQEWPRRFILGWSPSGICCACGEGRTPVIDKRYLSAGDKFSGGTPVEGRHNSGKRMGDGVEVTITGYACDCSTPSAPTRPAVVLDPFVGTGTVPMVARSLGRYGVGMDLSADYLRLARWRVFESGHAAKSIRRTNGERQGAML